MQSFKSRKADNARLLASLALAAYLFGFSSSFRVSMYCPNLMAGEQGFEPWNAGIKIQCLNQLGDSPTQSAVCRSCALLTSRAIRRQTNFLLRLGSGLRACLTNGREDVPASLWLSNRATVKVLVSVLRRLGIHVQKN